MEVYPLRNLITWNELKSVIINAITNEFILKVPRFQNTSYKIPLWKLNWPTLKFHTVAQIASNFPRIPPIEAARSAISNDTQIIKNDAIFYCDPSEFKTAPKSWKTASIMDEIRLQSDVVNNQVVIHDFGVVSKRSDPNQKSHRFSWFWCRLKAQIEPVPSTAFAWNSAKSVIR